MPDRTMVVNITQGIVSPWLVGAILSATIDDPMTDSAGIHVKDVPILLGRRQSLKGNISGYE